MDPRSEELAAAIAEIRERVRARNPNGADGGGLALADLMPLVRARDLAEGKVASIGAVNPRRPGPLNAIAQWVKRLAARALDWHVREQVEFNRAVLECVQSAIQALGECNRTLAALSARIDGLDDGLEDEAQQSKDIRAHWTEWRVDWEKKLTGAEIQLLRSIAELQAAFQQRTTLLDANYRELAKAQHDDFEKSLERAATGIQQRLSADLEEIRAEYESIIHAELRLVRQKASLAKTVERVAESAPAAFANVDWLKFAEKFRGSEAAVKERQRIYAERFQGCANVLDIGCGRGEMLEVLREAGIGARGIDLDDDSIALCRSKGLEAEKADLFDYLNALPDASLGGAVCCQVVEHLEPRRLPELIRMAHDKLREGALLAMETPNPECLAIFATHFYIDPTHRHPLPPALLSFYLEEAGFGRIRVERLYPAVESMPSLGELPEAFRKEFFGSLDYAVFGVRL